MTAPPWPGALQSDVIDGGTLVNPVLALVQPRRRVEREAILTAARRWIALHTPTHIQTHPTRKRQDPEMGCFALSPGLGPRDVAKKREPAGRREPDKPWRVVPKEVGAPACGMEARAWREGPDAPARRPRGRYLGTGSQHATAAASITRQRPRVEVAGSLVVPCCPNCTMVPGVCGDDIGGALVACPRLGL